MRTEDCLPDLFERQARRIPDAIAAVAGDDRVSYRELNARANQVAHQLIGFGVGPENVVGIYLEPGIDAVVAVWGVLKSGAAYLPMDVDFPPARIAAIMAAARLAGVITVGRHRPRLPSDAMPVLALDSAEEMARRPNTDPARPVVPGNAAVVIFTSGSTGRPKGVVLVHEALVHAYRFWEDKYELRDGVDSHCQVTRFPFAVFHADLIRAHCSGGKLVLCTADVVTSPRRLHARLRDEHVRFVEFVPVILRPLLGWVEANEEALSFLRIAVVSSDRWYVREHRRLQRVCGPTTRCLQSFGATETTIDTARFEEELDALPGNQLTPIGTAFPGVAVHIVDDELRRVPVGETGEMLIGGAGVARGYIGDPESTARRFLPDPTGSSPGARVYRSGDFARVLPGGAIQFVGRDDAQRKLRGFRVELGEIEGVLEARDDIVEAVAVIRGHDPDAATLVAYVVAADPANPPQTSVLRRFVAERLPDYMVPGAFVALDALPQTSTGKVDRNALPDPPAGRPDLGAFCAPRNAVEGVLASIWADVLDVSQISVHDDFFDLGGQSMTAAEVIAKLEDAFDVRLSLRDLFESPTVAQLAAKVADPGLEQGGDDRPRLEPVARNRKLRASFAQSRLWFLDQLRPGSTAHNITSLVMLRGVCDPGALERAVNEVVRRHEALRTTFDASDSGPMQCIAPSLRVPLQLLDVSGHVDPGAELRRAIGEEARSPFDLQCGPLVRVRLLRLAHDLHALVVGMHHIVTDGWSLRNFEQEVRSLHAAFVAGQESPLEPLRVQYADHTLWQHQWLQGPRLDRELAYWRQRLQAAPALTELPADRPRPSAASQRGAAWFSVLPAELTSDLDSLARREGATRFMTLLAGFVALVHRLSGATDLVIGTPTANRLHPDAAPLIGCFANTLALRFDLSARPTFRQVVARVREEVLEADRHQDVPFERVVDALRPERSLGHHAIFQIMFALQEAQELELAGDKLGLPTEPVTGDAQFDLAVSVQPTPSQIVVTWEYNTDLFDHLTIERLAGEFETLLAAAAAAPDTEVGRLEVMNAAERCRLLVDWNDTAVPYSGAVPEAFERQVARTPDAIAVVDASAAYTYADLNRRANRLAHALIERGIDPEDTVGICVQRSRDMIAAMLAVAKAGGLYVPLEPSFPAERIAFALEDTGARVLITEPEQMPRLSDAPPRLVLGAEGDDLSHYPEEDPAVPVHERSLLALIYTSGSTGRPKAAAIEHRSVVALSAWSPAVLSDEDLTGVLAVSSICFDLSLLEIFSTLIRGGRVLLAQDALQLPQFEAASEGRFLATFPAIIAELLRSGDVPSGLRTLNLGGEPFSRALVDRIYRTTGVERVHNMYGPTEDTVYSTYELLPRELGAAPRIGRPVGNTRVYVLDAQLRPLPVGVAGEVYLAGAGVARGYFNRPKLTAASFLPDPFSDRPGERMYRSGDIARHTNDGSLEYRGRADDQVKVRGYRIELGEIESVLSGHPDILEVAAAVHLDDAGEKQLVAYVVLAPGAEVSADQLSRFCARTLPRYMVPSWFVPVSAFPRKPNGKVDRKELPAPDGARLGKAGFVVPRTPTEEMLVAIWSELLGGARVSVTDNFFHIGGHSLLATRMLARVREAFGVEVSLRELFEAPTLSELARCIASASPASATVIKPARRDRPLRPSFAQQRLWWLEQLDTGAGLYNVTLQVRLPGATAAELVGSALEDITRRHESLRTTFVTTDGTVLQRIGPVLPVPVTLLDPRTASDAWRVAAQQAADPFDLERGPLLRACMLRVAEDVALLQVTLHHTATDGWSQGIFLDELHAFLGAVERGQRPALAPPPIQYADYAAWQREQMTGNLLHRRLAYWSDALGSDPPRCELPADRPRPAAPDHRGAIQRFAVPDAVTARLLEIGREEGATLFMTLLAAFAVFAQRVTGQDRLVLGTATANRMRPETERVIGLFVNTLALPVDVSGNPSFRALLARVRDVALGAFANQDLPYEKLVEHLAPERSLSRDPLIDVMLVLQNAVGGDVADTPSPTDGAVLPGIAKFDVSVTVTHADRLILSWEYGRALFDDRTIVRFSDALMRVLEDVARGPAAPIADVSLLSPDERERLVHGWSATESEPPPRDALPVALDRQAAARPDATAIASPHGKLSYAELRSRANRLARLLCDRGIEREARVAVSLTRSPNLVVAVFGVLKAGGAYMPIDPELPESRRRFMLDDADARWIVTETALADRFAGYEDRLIAIDRVEDELAELPDQAPARRLYPHNLAYVIYTSGTTGTPKGAMIEHRGLANLELSTRVAFGLGPDDRMLQLSSASFDASIFEIVIALGAGATLCMATPELLTPGLPLERTIDEFGVSATCITPSALTALDSAAMPSLRTVIAAAEPCSYEVARAWTGRGRRVFNAYGPTEATVWAAVATVDGTRRPPIGRPVANARTYVLDERMEPVPVGVVGELHIGGIGVGRGYLNRPEATAAAYVPDPFASVPGARLYRTGDLCRFLPDGSIDYVGRRDDQVKLRGFRIELGEIGSALEQHPSVRAAVAGVVDEDSPRKRLVAYVVLEPGMAFEPGVLRGWVEDRLPAYMVPAVVMQLDGLPLSSTGKVDRRSLPVPPVATGDDSAATHTTDDPIEDVVAAIWAQCLELDDVGRDDDFFELGGHSLLAAELIGRIGAACGVQLDVPLLFEARTVRKLAQAVMDAMSAGARTAAPLSPAVRTASIPLTRAQARVWAASRLRQSGRSYNLSGAVTLPGGCDTRALTRALDAVVERHEALRTRIVAVDGRPRQAIERALQIDVPIIDLSDLDSERAAEAVRRRLDELAATRFELDTAPLLTAVLLRLRDHDRFGVAVHHAVADGWSLRVLFGELLQLYEAFRQGLPSPLAPLPAQFADWVLWQRARRPSQESQRAFWSGRLSGLPECLVLAGSRPRPALSRNTGRTCSFMLDEDVVTRLRALHRGEGCTLFTILLAAYATLLHWRTGATDLPIATDMANRLPAGAETLIGMLINQVVLRLDMGAASDLGALLRQARRVVAEAYANQSVPFEELVDELVPRRDPSRPPLAQYKLVLENTGAELHAPLVAENSREPESPHASEDVPTQLDLTLYAYDLGARIRGLLVYDAELFDDDLAASLAAELREILSEMAAAAPVPATGDGR